MTTKLETQSDHSIDQARLLALAGELDRFSRRFERFCVVQLEQLESAFSRLADDQAQWERRRAREMRQIEENRRALQEAWAAVRSGNGDVAVEQPRLEADIEPEPPLRTTTSAAGDPLRLLLSPGAENSEMLIGTILLELARLNRAHGGPGCRFELSGCYRESSGGTILDLHVFPAVPPVAIEKGEVSDEVLCWQRYKSAIALLPLGRGLDRLIKSAAAEPKDHEAAQVFASAARRAHDGDTRTAESVQRGKAAVREYSDRLVDQFESQRDSGLAMQAVALA